MTSSADAAGVAYIHRLAQRATRPGVAPADALRTLVTALALARRGQLGVHGDL